MKYTFKNKSGRPQTIDIKESDLSRISQSLGCGAKEAIEVYLYDNGYVDNAEAAELTEKAAQNKVTLKNKSNGKPRKAPERKPDYVKRMLIGYLEECLAEVHDLKNDEDEVIIDHCADVRITNIERIIAFTIGNDNYELTLSKKRKPKD